MTAAEAKERLLHSKMPNDAEQREYDLAVLHALDKQIPGEYVRAKCGAIDYNACPICRKHVSDNYCPNCGQKIYWGDIK